MCGWPAGVGYPPADGELEQAATAAPAPDAEPAAHDADHVGVQLDALAGMVARQGQEASVAIQVSGAFGSRQEEAQRLGRILRPKADGRAARFYAIVSRDTVDQDFAQHRQRFLAEQGYSYTITDADDLPAADLGTTDDR